MVVCVPVTGDGTIDPRWGRARRVAVAEVTAAGILRWEEHDVGWDELHEAGTEGSHHARVVRFLRENGVEAVIAEHLGPGMAHMLDRMGIRLRLGAAGDARRAVLSVAAPA